MPFFSVVIPTYNYGRFIGQTINSALAQSFDNFEAIIVDNYSSDNTEEIVRSYKDPRLRYFKFANQGVVAASRNYAIKQAEGDFIAFLDADDLWYPDKLEKSYNFLLATSSDLICHDEYWTQGTTKTPVQYGPWINYEDILFKGNSFSTSAVVVRRSKLLEAGLFNAEPKFAGSEDYELWLRLSRICSIKFLHETLGEYIIHNASLTKALEHQVKVYLNAIDLHYNENFRGKFKFYIPYLMRKADIIRQGGRDLAKNNELRIAWKYYLLSLKVYPLLPKTWWGMMKLLLNKTIPSVKFKK